MEEIELKAVYPGEAIKEVGESLGLTTLTDESVEALADDIDFRLKEVIQEAMKFMRHGKRSRLTLDDVSHALRVRSVEPLYGFNASRGLSFSKVAYANQDLYYVQDREIELENFLQTPLPPAQPDQSFSVHWLAVEGVQPAIPQNPVKMEKPELFPLKKAKVATGEPVIRKNTETAEIEVKPLVKHVLSMELRVYFERIASAMVGDDEGLKNSAFDSLSKDPGLQQLLPYFVQYIADKTTKSLADINILRSMLRAIEAILKNEHFFVEPYLHQINPIVLSCLLAKKIGKNQVSTTFTHWDLRHFASKLVVVICDICSKSYETVKSRMARTLLRSLLDTNKPLSTFYGAILGLGSFGPDFVSFFIGSNLNSISNRLMGFQDEPQASLQRCIKLLANVMSKAGKDMQLDDSMQGVSIAKLNELIAYAPLSQAIILHKDYKSICQFIEVSITQTRESAQKKLEAAQSQDQAPNQTKNEGSNFNQEIEA